MERSQAVAACVAEMNRKGLFAEHSDDQKAKAAEYAFARLHEDAEKFLPFGGSEDDVKHYAKAATRRVHQQVKETPAGEFEQANGFPLLLVLGLLPTLWSWWKLFKEWMGW